MSSTLKKSLKIIEAVAMSESPRGISELARDIKLDKSLVQRILQTLAEENYVEKTADTSRYRPTLRLWELGSRVIEQNDTRRLIHPILRYAAKASNLTAYFAAADHPDVIYLDKIEGEKGRANSSDPGRRIPMYAAASGRAILAFSPANQLKPIIQALEKKGGSKAELESDLANIRARFFATTERGTAVRISSVAAPVWGLNTSPIGSIVLTSDSVTFPPSEFDRIGSIALGAAEQATKVLGGIFPIGIDHAP